MQSFPGEQAVEADLLPDRVLSLTAVLGEVKKKIIQLGQNQNANELTNSLVRILFNVGEIDPAIDLFEAISENAHSLLGIEMTRIRIQITLNPEKDCTQSIEGFIQRFPDQVGFIYESLYTFYSDVGENNKTEEYEKKAIAANPEFETTIQSRKGGKEKGKEVKKNTQWINSRLQREIYSRMVNSLRTGEEEAARVFFEILELLIPFHAYGTFDQMQSGDRAKLEQRIEKAARAEKERQILESVEAAYEIILTKEPRDEGFAEAKQVLHAGFRLNRKMYFSLAGKLIVMIKEKDIDENDHHNIIQSLLRFYPDNVEALILCATAYIEIANKKNLSQAEELLQKLGEIITGTEDENDLRAIIEKMESKIAGIKTTGYKRKENKGMKDQEEKMKFIKIELRKAITQKRYGDAKEMINDLRKQGIEDMALLSYEFHIAIQQSDVTEAQRVFDEIKFGLSTDVAIKYRNAIHSMQDSGIQKERPGGAVIWRTIGNRVPVNRLAAMVTKWK